MLRIKLQLDMKFLLGFQHLAFRKQELGEHTNLSLGEKPKTKVDLNIWRGVCVRKRNYSKLPCLIVGINHTR